MAARFACDAARSLVNASCRWDVRPFGFESEQYLRLCLLFHHGSWYCVPNPWCGLGIRS